MRQDRIVLNARKQFAGRISSNFVQKNKFHDAHNDLKSIQTKLIQNQINQRLLQFKFKLIIRNRISELLTLSQISH